MVGNEQEQEQEQKKKLVQNTTNTTAPVRLRAWLLRNTPRCRKNVYDGLEKAYYL